MKNKEKQEEDKKEMENNNQNGISLKMASIGRIIEAYKGCYVDIITRLSSGHPEQERLTCTQ